MKSKTPKMKSKTPKASKATQIKAFTNSFIQILKENAASDFETFKFNEEEIDLANQLYSNAKDLGSPSKTRAIEKAIKGFFKASNTTPDTFINIITNVYALYFRFTGLKGHGHFVKDFAGLPCFDFVVDGFKYDLSFMSKDFLKLRKLYRASTTATEKEF